MQVKLDSKNIDKDVLVSLRSRGWSSQFSFGSHVVFVRVTVLFVLIIWMQFRIQRGEQCPLSLTATENGPYHRHCWSACFVLNLFLYGRSEIKLLNLLAVHVLSCVLSRPFSRCDSLSRFGDFVVVLLETQTSVFVRTGYNGFEQRSLITWIIIEFKMLTLLYIRQENSSVIRQILTLLTKELVSFCIFCRL